MRCGEYMLNHEETKQDPDYPTCTSHSNCINQYPTTTITTTIITTTRTITTSIDTITNTEVKKTKKTLKISSH
jgi:hypothetical protein